jgi:iduronate 2-sulfatase
MPEGRARLRLPLLMVLATAAACGGRGPVGPRAARPSVLFVVFDDLSYHIGLYGGAARTPQLERLAQRGRRFDRAYCQYPLCSPSRTSFLTGWGPEKTQVWGNLRPPRAWLEGAIPLQEHFHANGYFTARVGKVYHSRFESEFRWDFTEDTYDDAADEQVQGAIGWGPSPRQDADEPDGRAARRAVRLLEEKKDVPFFIGVGFLKPHDPWVVPEPYLRMYPPAAVTLPPEAPDHGDDAIHEPRRGAPFEIPLEKRREARAAYQAAVTFVDAQLGLLLDALDRLHLWDHTVVVVLGDNGVHVGEHGIFGKMTLFEESARVPLLLAAPGLERPGTPTGRLVELLDLYPTLLELCRLPPVEGLEGTSLLPLLRDPDHPWKEAAYTLRKVGATKKGQLARSVRTERYRYTEWPDGETELYDHQTDPGEFNNLAEDPRRAADLKELRKTLRAGARARLPAGARASPGGEP